MIEKAKQLLSFAAKRSHPGFFILLQIILGVLLATVSLVAFVKISDEVIEKETVAFDTAVQSFVYSLRSPVMTDIMFGASFAGSKELLLSVSIIIIAFLCFKGRKRTAFIYSTILLTSSGLNHLIKMIVRRDRPELLPLENASFYSFPSGHAMNSLVFYGLLAYFTYRFAKNKTVGIAAYILAGAITLLIGFSRIYLGAHYPTDVLAGFIAGLFILATAAAIEKTAKLNKLFEGSEKS